MLRLLIIASIALVGLSLACSPAKAEEPQDEASTTTIEKTETAVVPLPTTHRGRLSTRDRWRGAPYLRSSADETLRSQALDVALPPANSAFQGGASLQSPGVLSNEDYIRNQALDKSLYPFNAAVVGGGSIQGGVGF